MPDKFPKQEWVVNDPLNRPVELNSERKKHIIDGHPEFGTFKYIERLSEVITSPHMILKDLRDFDTEVYCRNDIGTNDFAGNWIKVPVRFDVTDTGSIITAYFDINVPKGTIKWLPKNIIK